MLQTAQRIAPALLRLMKDCVCPLDRARRNGAGLWSRWLAFLRRTHMAQCASLIVLYAAKLIPGSEFASAGSEPRLLETGLYQSHCHIL